MFEPEPKWPFGFRRQLSFSRLDNSLHTFAAETIVTQVDLLDVAAMVEYYFEVFSCLIIYLVAKELKDLEVWATPTNVSDFVEACSRDGIFGKVDLFG